jgi:hypothetical protein
MDDREKTSTGLGLPDDARSPVETLPDAPSDEEKLPLEGQ